MARDSTMGRDRVLAVPSTGIALDSPSTSQLTAGPPDINQQILEVIFRKKKLRHSLKKIAFSHFSDFFKLFLSDAC